MRSQCPACGTIYKIIQEYLGRTIQCKKCGHSFVIEAVPTENQPPAAQPLSPLPPPPPPSVDQNPQMVQVVCQHCGTLNQMPPGVVCNCGRCGQPLPAVPTQSIQTQPAVASNFAIGQTLSTAFSTLFKKPVIIFALAIAASAPAFLFLIKFGEEFTDKNDLILTSIVGALNGVSFMYMEAWVIYAVFKILGRVNAKY